MMEDFRARLNNQREVPNEASWQQMEQLLAQFPAENKKKRRFLFFLIPIAIGVFAVGFYFYSMDTKNINTESKAIYSVSSSKEEIKIKELAASPSIGTTTQIVEDPKQASFTIRNEKLLAKEIILAKSNASELGMVGYESKLVVEDLHSPTKYEFSSANDYRKADVDSSTNNGTKDGLLNKKAEETQNVGSQMISDIQPSAPQLAESEVIEKTREKTRELIQMLFLPTINNSPFLYPRPLPNILNSKFPLKHKSGKFYTTLRSGYASFNGNPGYQLGFGMFREVNKIIGCELEAVHSYGSEQGVIDNLPFTFEKQTDLNFVFHLNLARVRRHKLSIELGVGYTMYQGERVHQSSATIDYRKSQSNNYNGGLSYTYFISNSDFIGVKGGFISYDDGIGALTLRYGKSFF